MIIDTPFGPMRKAETQTIYTIPPRDRTRAETDRLDEWRSFLEHIPRMTDEQFDEWVRGLHPGYEPDNDLGPT